MSPVCGFHKIKARHESNFKDMKYISPLPTWYLVSILHLNALSRPETQSICGHVGVGPSPPGQCSQGHPGVTITPPWPWPKQFINKTAVCLHQRISDRVYHINMLWDFKERFNCRLYISCFMKSIQQTVQNLIWLKYLNALMDRNIDETVIRINWIVVMF